MWVRRSNFRHQASPRVSPRESTQRRKVELWAKKVREFCLNADFHVTFRDLLHAVKLRHGTDGFTCPPKEGVLRIFFRPKNPTASSKYEPTNLGSKGQHVTSRPPKPLLRCVTTQKSAVLLMSDKALWQCLYFAEPLHCKSGLRDAGMTWNIWNVMFDVKNKIFTHINVKRSLLSESYPENTIRDNYAQIEGKKLNSKFVKITFSSFTLNEICLQSPLGRPQNPTICHRHLAKHCSISCYKFYRLCVPFHDNSRKFSRSWRIKYL